MDSYYTHIHINVNKQWIHTCTHTHTYIHIYTYICVYSYFLGSYFQTQFYCELLRISSADTLSFNQLQHLFQHAYSTLPALASLFAYLVTVFKKLLSIYDVFSQNKMGVTVICYKTMMSADLTNFMNLSKYHIFLNIQFARQISTRYLSF